VNHTVIDKIRSLGDEFYLLRISISPVQEFITEARKTRDLHMGSRLLSLATLESMKPICVNYGREFIIYPHLGNSNAHSSSTPNLYMAVIQKGELEGMITRMETCLHDFWKGVDEKVRNKISGFNDWKLWDHQMRDHFYMNWVAIPITSEELKNSYKSKAKDAQRFLDEQKLTRTFEVWKGDNVTKCVQCGHRERMPDELFSKLRENKKFKMRIKDNERLCAVCLLKRILNTSDIKLDKIKFESVSDVSARPFKRSIEDDDAKEEMNDFLNAINDLKKCLGEDKVYIIKDLGGEWFYKESLRYEYLKKEYKLEDNSELEKLAKNAHEKLDKVYKKIESKPCKYYVIVSMDGDDMGKLMSGEFLDDESFTIDHQTNLSKKLSETGKKASELIEKDGNGYCVYSGGDDLLAFHAIKDALQTIKKVRSSFGEEFEELNKKPTSSAGIVILNHHDPLRKGLVESRRSVEKAKELFKGKDAFFITLRVFSGSVITWGSKWTIDNLTIQEESISQIQVIDLLERVVFFMNKDEKHGLSPDFIRDLMGELPAFYRYNKRNSKWSFEGKMFRAEFERLLKRHIPKESDVWDDLWEGNDKTLCLMKEVFAYMADPDRNKQYKKSVKDNFENFLRIALFLAREESGRPDKR